MRPDLLIAGAGPSGCVIAEQAARLMGWTSLIVEKRNHIGGNCYDRYHSSGVLIHEYGPHYFRTNNPNILNYLSRFTDWIPGNYVCKSVFRGETYPFPINLKTLEKFFGQRLTPSQAKNLLVEKTKDYAAAKFENFEQYVLALVGPDLYQAFYETYTRKQWGISPTEIHASVARRIPVRLTYDERYVDQRYQLMPARGYTEMFIRMTENPRIKLLFDADFFDVRTAVRPRVATVFTGPLDAYFDFRFGKLPWRSLQFEHVVHPQEFMQPCVQLNYPDDRPYTRSVEYKHVTRQRSELTVVSWEKPSSSGDPFYPVPGGASAGLAATYRSLAAKEEKERKVFFCGRLGQYQYINMDEAVELAMRLFRKLQSIAPCGTTYGRD